MEGVGGGNLQKTSSASSRKCLRMKNQPHNLMSKLKTVQITKEPEKRATIELNTRILEIVALPCVVRNINCLNQIKYCVKELPAAICAHEQATEDSAHPIFETSPCVKVPRLPAMDFQRHVIN